MGPVQPESPAFWIGVSVSPLEPALRAQLQLPQNEGLLAIDVVKESPAAQADIKVHDILLSLDGKPLDGQEKFVELVQSNGEKSVPIEAHSRGERPRQSGDAPTSKALSAPVARGLVGQSLQLSPGIRPGAVVNFSNRDWIADGTGRQLAVLQIPTQGHTAAGESATSAKRLDDLDAEIKQLRKAVEELTRILKDKK